MEGRRPPYAFLPIGGWWLSGYRIRARRYLVCRCVHRPLLQASSSLLLQVQPGAAAATTQQPQQQQAPTPPPPPAVPAPAPPTATPSPSATDSILSAFDDASLPATPPPPSPPPPPPAASSNGDGNINAQLEAHPKWPMLSKGADDIFFVTTLQTGLEDAGFSVPEIEVDDMSFWDLTEHSLLCFQACKGLPETGFTDGQTWLALLGEQATRPPPYELVSAPACWSTLCHTLSASLHFFLCASTERAMWRTVRRRVRRTSRPRH